jgi:hypothetical protein
MIKLTDIYYTAENLLKNKYGYEVYGNEVTEGYESPSFFLEIKPKSITVEGPFRRKFTYTISITYNQAVSGEIDNLTKVDEMLDLFGSHLVLAGKRTIDLSSFTYEFVGDHENILKFSMDTEYYDKWESTSQSGSYELATEINIKNELKGE